MEISKLKISAVSYLNTLPFIYGLENSELIHQIDLQLDMPSDCAQKLLDNKVDIGLVPVAIIPQLNEHYIISDYCIGAKGKVNTVLLLSDVPLDEIEEIQLDYQSKTSVSLVQVLAKEFWGISPKWIDAQKGYEDIIEGTTAGVIIGDRTFNLSKTYQYKYDLAEEWFKFTSLPFVFACWVANKKIDNNLLHQFNEALKFGVKNINEVIRESNSSTISKEKLKGYLTNDISYHLDEDKQKAIQKFLNYLNLKQTESLLFL
jgi:chorismate dehydratase